MGLGGVLESCECDFNRLVSDEVENDADLSRRNADLSEFSSSFHYFSSLLLACGLASNVTLEGSGGSELTELVADHILGNIYRNMLSAIVNCECVTYEVREYCRGTAPCLENLLLSCFVHCQNSLVESFLDVRSLFNTSSHV